MRSVRILCVTCLILASATALLSYQQAIEAPGQQMSAAAIAFVEALDAEQKGLLQVPYDSPKRLEWHFVPLETRKGLPLKSMNEAQHDLARDLLATALSESGRKKVHSIVGLEKLLQALEGPDRRWPRDWQLYYVTLFGDPAGDGRWGLSFEGHHLSLNFVVEQGKVISSTPQFLGANPATVMTGGAGVEKGTRILADEETLAFDLLSSLNAEQRKQAVISETAPRDIRAGGEPQPPQDPPVGLAVSEMDSAQRQTLRRLVETYAAAMPAPVARERLDAIRDAGVETIRFAWQGADKPGIGHGYRVQGPTFVIEFVNTQPDAEGNPANHIHSVWRDMRGDFALPINAG